MTIGMTYQNLRENGPIFLETNVNINLANIDNEVVNASITELPIRIPFSSVFVQQHVNPMSTWMNFCFPELVPLH